MPSTVSPSRRPGGGRWWRWRTLTRGDLLTFLVAAMLCSASYCLAIWHNSRGAADSRVVLGPSAGAGAAGASWPCGSDARAGAAESRRVAGLRGPPHRRERRAVRLGFFCGRNDDDDQSPAGIKRGHGVSGELAWASARRPPPAPGGDPALWVGRSDLRVCRVSTSEPW
ncbi:unnamed protein product [Miscanthus lutarioriparius]|uniref:Uncharacterized protein n=1 Tax=Miscanthus lutarioriparius TaxID=422564 RepID=A0A811MWF6_9POAL|nr:unnamed protein product [Miscanthus lutarioriparius]